MAHNDYFTVAYKILSYLKYCYEEGQNPDLDILDAPTFKISNNQFYKTLMMLMDDGYIQGLKFTPTKTGTIVSNMDRVYITSDGLQYLEENTMMRKAYKIFKEVRDWLPLMK